MARQSYSSVKDGGSTASDAWGMDFKSVAPGSIVFQPLSLGAIFKAFSVVEQAVDCNADKVLMPMSYR